uniref:Myotubularin phosphatase domain-containing protein n=1 Tax=Sus scrofa TaxID=9823 RepID=A0A8D1K1L0_PIG
MSLVRSQTCSTKQVFLICILLSSWLPHCYSPIYKHIFRYVSFCMENSKLSLIFPLLILTNFVSFFAISEEIVPHLLYKNNPSTCIFSPFTSFFKEPLSPAFSTCFFDCFIPHKYARYVPIPKKKNFSYLLLLSFFFLVRAFFFLNVIGPPYYCLCYFCLLSSQAVKVEKTNVLVHCSDGWDRTAQVCSVASILLDPFYRTFKGLMILIEKEWISMGHKFSQRCGHLDGDPKEVSPIFTQFLDCIWQLMEQFPCAFEFNENFLLEIHDHVFSCQFGNFLGNCQKDREDMRIYEKTHSLWPFLVQRKPDFRNPLYKGFTVYGVLNPSTVPYNIQFWCGMYNRFDKGLQPKQSMLESLLQIKKQRTVLEANVHKLEKKLKGHDESPEEVCSCSQLGNLLSQHLGSPLSSPLGFMGVDGDFSTLMENGTLSREGSLQVQLDQVKSQWEYLHHDCCGIMDNLRAINISGDVGFSGDRGISGNTGTSEAIGFYGDISISEDMSFSGSMVISEDTGLSKASTKGADCSKHQ